MMMNPGWLSLLEASHPNMEANFNDRDCTATTRQSGLTSSAHEQLCWHAAMQAGRVFTIPSQIIIKGDGPSRHEGKGYPREKLTRNMRVRPSDRLGSSRWLGCGAKEC
ncbi:MAG: hypothetical protein Nkreftii_002675 [Candidatus Nitrospira kreftii]|uniref:Uncharacterized protein n=1 Tax=Candidatus Nitrospira kreftii TaxID=2652173 RepID=A0A7S8FFK9_9BACT|nr:MAG: hypothetical protein Nkreftii_002675 [Candidatus Nitrospira kreftii]